MKRAVAVAVASAIAFTTKAEAHPFMGCKKTPCKKHVVKPFLPKLHRIIRCESGHRWRINGLYDGALQFDPGTWNATGSRYDFAYEAPPIEQLYRGVVWAKMIGWAWGSTAGWPVCGRR